MHNYLSMPKGHLQAKSACWPFSGKFTGLHIIAGSQKTVHWIHHSFVKKCEVLGTLAQKMQPNYKTLANS
jgi:hypothetical protein